MLSCSLSGGLLLHLVRVVSEVYDCVTFFGPSIAVHSRPPRLPLVLGSGPANLRISCPVPPSSLSPHSPMMRYTNYFVMAMLARLVPVRY